MRLIEILYYLRQTVMKFGVGNPIINEFTYDELEVAQDKVLFVTIRRSEHVSQANAVSAPVRFYKSGSLVNNDYRKLAALITE